MAEPSSKTGDPDVGARIALRRKELGLSRADLARAADLSYSYIAQIETGYRMPSAKQQVIIAKVLGSSLDELFGTPDDDGLPLRPPVPPGVGASSRTAPPATRAPRLSIDEAVDEAAHTLESLPPAVRLDALSRIQLRIMRGVAADSPVRPGRPGSSGSWIEHLREDEVFVFGSNADGRHAAGAARMAYERFGAEWGEGSGLHGQSYGIVTRSGFGTIVKEVAAFLGFARNHPELRFLVTPIGTGVAGYRADEIAPLFDGAPDNVVLPPEFVDD